MTEAGGGLDPSREWFRDWFGEEYLELYPHRDEAEAAEAVRLYLTKTVSGPVLDLACGAGRHLRELERAGLSVVGLDLSSVLLAAARRSSPSAPLVRADMRRLPFRPESFGGLTSFFTSFGYFRSREEDRQVVRGVREVLRPGGSFMLDFFNEARVRETLVARDERFIAGRRVIQTREIRDDTVIKHIRLEMESDGAAHESSPDREFEERVRLYKAPDLTDLLEAEGLQVERMFGGYDGAPFGATSERLILAGVAR